MLIKVADGSYIDPARIWAIYVDDSSDDIYVKVNDGAIIELYSSLDDAAEFVVKVSRADKRGGVICGKNATDGTARMVRRISSW